MGISATDISQRIVEAVLAQKLAPGARLGEQQLAMLFDCSRTIVREALTRLAARGIVTVSARRGWYLISPSQDEAREAFEARRVIELGLLRGGTPLGKPALVRLKKHLQQEKAALRGDDVGTRSFLLGDFHVCLAECLGNQARWHYGNGPRCDQKGREQGAKRSRVGYPASICNAVRGLSGHNPSGRPAARGHSALHRLPAHACGWRAAP